MNRPTAAHTKLLLCVWHSFTLWHPPADVAAQIRRRWPEMRVVGRLGDTIWEAVEALP